jgi:hypothetical protein
MHDVYDYPGHSMGFTEQVYAGDVGMGEFQGEGSPCTNLIGSDLAASLICLARSPPRPLSFVLFHHLLYLNNQLPILR